MKVFIINVNWGNGGPGGIACDLYHILEENGHECCFAYARGDVPSNINSYRIGKKIDVYRHAFIARLCDNAGFLSTRVTKKLVEVINEFNPDVISIQNPLGYSMNIEYLLKYIKEKNILTFWTLHDCWSFTGHCTTELCDKLSNGCGNCPHKKEFPKSILLDRSSVNLKRKQINFSNVRKLQFIAPSNWIANLAKQSYLSQYPISLIHNGIDLDIFKPTKSDLQSQYFIEHKKIILAVASIWSKRKGSKYLYEMAEKMNKSYVLIIIGRNNDKNLKKFNNIIHIDRTENRTQLAQWYTLADVFVNPTVGDNFPTVNLEALACGTPVVSFDTGGCSEAIGDCGYVVPQGNIKELLIKVNMCIEHNISSEKCMKRARRYDKHERYQDYISLFESQIRD